MHRLVALDGSTSALHRPEPETRRNTLLDEAMVLLQDVVQIRCGSATTASAQLTSLLQVGDRDGVGWVSVHIVTRGRGAPPHNARPRKSFAAIRSRFGDNMNSMVSPAESTARYRYAQLPATLM